jgi:hypothetical protein
MALTRDFEIQDTGLEVANAYHVIVHIDIEKKMADEAEATLGRQYSGDIVEQNTAGYYGRIVVKVWKDEAARAADKLSIGVINATYGVPDLFKLDMSSTDTYLTQAYAHLLSTDYYANAS